MRKLLHLPFLFSLFILSCSLFSADLPDGDSVKPIPCPLDSCQKVSIELSLQGFNYAAPFTCYEWTDWGTGLEVDWKDDGKILFFTFSYHRICKAEFRICGEEPADRIGGQVDCNWQPVESCPRNNTLTVALDSCLFSSSTLFLDVFLQDQ